MSASTARRRFLGATLSTAIVACLGKAALAAATLEPVALEPIEVVPSTLTVIGPDGSRTSYTQERLETLETHRMTTSTEWHGDDAVFEGVLFDALLAHHGFPADMAVRVIAENDYGITFRPNEIAAAPILVATRVNGEGMSRRSRGPYFFAIDASEVASDEGLNERHLVWFAKTIRPAAPDEL